MNKILDETAQHHVVRLKIHRPATDKAHCVLDMDGEPLWLPKSSVTMDNQEGGTADFTIANWLIMKHKIC